MRRREFLKLAGAGAAAAAMGGAGMAVASDDPDDATQPAPSAEQLAKKLPRWRGFNLLEKFNVRRNEQFVERDFEWIRAWGFDFVRLPMDYRCWTDADDPYGYDEKILKHIDAVIDLGRQYGVHVSLNLHRAPGYTVAKPAETLNLWQDEEAQKQFDAQWSMFAKRYKGVPSHRLSFDLVNEPAKVAEQVYAKVARRVVGAIRAADPERLIITDGLDWGNTPIPSLADLGIAQSTRGYQPMGVSHYMASWVGGEKWAKPTWPLKRGGETLDREWLSKDRLEPWRKLAKQGVGVHVGEWGAYNKTPHCVVLAWAKDWLELWREADFGWALWNLRGSFGVVDSGRDDVKYEDLEGHKLDRKLLELIRAH